VPPLFAPFTDAPLTDCGRPITTREHAAATAAAAELPDKNEGLCDGCKKRLVSERLASPGR